MATGKALEALVTRSARRQGLEMRRNTPGMTVVGRDASNRAVGFAHNTGRLDFEGFLASGQHFTFDAKSAKGQSFPLRNIKRHQAVIVRRTAEKGRMAFFLVEMTEAKGGPRYFALCWPTLQPFWDRKDYGGSQSIPLSVLERECLEIPFDGRHLDLVDALEQIAEVA
jgi:recombination protein U